MDDNELDKLFGIEGEEAEEEIAKAEPAKTDSESSAADKKEEKNGKPEKSEEPEKQEKTEEPDKAEEDVTVEEAEEEPEPKEVVGIEEYPEPKPKKRELPKIELPEIHIPRAGVLAIALVSLVVLIVCLIAFLPAFRLRTVQIEGNIVLTDEEILEMAGLEYDKHLMSGVSGNLWDVLCLNYGNTEKQIMATNPYVEDITITIKLPSTVYIEVKERSKIAYIKTPDGYAALDRNGLVLELESGEDAEDVRPLICGMQLDSINLGSTVEIKNRSDYDKAIIVLGAILAADNASVGGSYSMFANTKEVRILPSGYVFLTIYSPSQNLIQIKLSDTEGINEDMEWLLYAINANAFDNVTGDGALDMTGDEYIYDEY
ncbi:MAG: FtsQ-type POTRA domain-containing protein [Saccharofermentans sp.]|nr:FtsQ-type POTRA domain-containing protein [Saccharofermentans sp.]